MTSEVSNEELLEISKDEMPSGKISVSLREPTFKDRVEANKRVPDDSNMGYSIPQLMVSMCMKKVNNKEVGFKPQDPVSNIRPFPTRDQQFIISVFSGAFYLDDDLVEDVQSLADELRNQDAREAYTIPSDRTPTGNLSVTFRVPSTGDQIDLDRRYPGHNQQVGYAFEEFLFANLITSVNGEQLGKNDGLSEMFKWKNIDAEYCLAVFIQMNFLDQETRRKANDIGKKWRTRERSSAKTSKSQEDTTDTQK